MEVLKILFMIGFGIFAIDRFGLWLERKDLVYWRYKKSSHSSSGNALLELISIMNPGAKHAIELSQKEDVKERDDQGDLIDPLNLEFED